MPPKRKINPPSRYDTAKSLKASRNQGPRSRAAKRAAQAQPHLPVVQILTQGVVPSQQLAQGAAVSAQDVIPAQDATVSLIPAHIVAPSQLPAQGAVVSMPHAQLDQAALVSQITENVLHALRGKSTQLHTDTFIPTTDSTVSGSTTNEVVSQAIQTLINGGDTGELAMRPPTTYQSISNPLGSTISKSIKSRIWTNEYINLSALLNNQDDDISLTLNKSEGKPTISLTSSSRWEISSIELWTKAFLVFSAIYSERYPAEAPHLFKYISVVREMAYQKKPWLSYDKQFRLLKATNTAQWSEINWELYFRGESQRVQQQSFHNKFKPSYKPGKRSRVPSGFCFDFHTSNSCTRKKCEYKHLCHLCQKGNHSATKCYRSSKFSANDKEPVSR